MADSSGSTVDSLSFSQGGKETTVNDYLDAASTALLFGRRRSTTTGLTWGYYGGKIWVDGVLTTIGNSTLALTASQTNYVEATRAGVVSKNTTGFTAGSIPLYEVVTNGSAITSYTDRRILNTARTGILSKSVAGSSNVTLTAAEARNNILMFTGVLTGNINVVVPLPAQEWIVFNNTTGAFTLTMIGATGTGAAITQATKTLVYSDGTNVNALTSGSITAGAGLYTSSGTTYANAGHPAEGRLTLSSGVPVMVSDVINSTSIHYTLHTGNHIALYDGTDWVLHEFTELTNTTTDNTKNPAAVANNSNYDMFVWNDSGTLRLGRGPAWVSDTAPGTGAGTTELERVDGVRVNKFDITNGPAARRGRYEGTVRSNGSATIDWQLGGSAAGGKPGFLHVWNEHNRVHVEVTAKDTTNSWTNSTATWVSANGSDSNRVSFVRGLDEDGMTGVYTVVSDAAAGKATTIGVGLDTNAAASGAKGYFGNAAISVGSSGWYAGAPGLGYHYLQAVEKVLGGVALTFYGDGGGDDLQMGLYVSGEF